MAPHAMICVSDRTNTALHGPTRRRARKDMARALRRTASCISRAARRMHAEARRAPSCSGARGAAHVDGRAVAASDLRVEPAQDQHAAVEGDDLAVIGIARRSLGTDKAAAAWA